jgi:hypothetical protein
MSLPTELNIKITHEGSTIRLSLPELGIATTAGDLWEALDNLVSELSDKFLEAIEDNDGQSNDFVEACAGIHPSTPDALLVAGFSAFESL